MRLKVLVELFPLNEKVFCIHTLIIFYAYVVRSSSFEYPAFFSFFFFFKCQAFLLLLSLKLEMHFKPNTEIMFARDVR